MNHLKAILLGAGVWLVLFAVASIVLFAASRFWISPVMLVLAPILAFIASNYYLQEEKTRQTLIGFCLGIIWLVTGAILDYLVVVRLFNAGTAFYTASLLAGYAETLAVPTLAGYWIEHRKNSKHRR